MQVDVKKEWEFSHSPVTIQMYPNPQANKYIYTNNAWSSKKCQGLRWQQNGLCWNRL